MALRLVAAALAFILISSGTAPAASSFTQLISIHSVTADDGSSRITLLFDGEAPPTRIIHSVPNLVHVVFFGGALQPNANVSIAPSGEIISGKFNSFAAIGLRLDLLLRNRVRVTQEIASGGDTVVLHIAAPHSDLESSLDIGVIDRGNSQTVFIPLSYADVSEVAGLLVKGASIASLDGFTPQSPFAAPTPNPNSNSGSSSSGGARTPTYVTLPTAAIMTKDVSQGTRLDDHVAIDRRLNAVILTDTPEQIKHDRQLIAYVDVPTPSILLEAEVVELTESGAEDLGLNFSPNGQALATASTTLTSGGKAVSSVAIGAQLHALETAGSAKILARPRILTVNGRTAAILSGEAVPITTSVLVPSGGGTIIENQVQYINVGVSLQILPRVSADGRVTTQVFSEVSSIIDYVGNAPRIAVRQALTSGIVGDGESLLVGGLLQKTEITSLSKVPGLGDLPLIGGLFRNKSTSSQTTNLYLIITPHVITEKPAPTPTKPPAR